MLPGSTQPFSPFFFRTLAIDLAALQRVDLNTIAWIARLNLDARRAGVRLELNNPCQELVALIKFCGMAEVLGIQPPMSDA